MVLLTATVLPNYCLDRLVLSPLEPKFHQIDFLDQKSQLNLLVIFVHVLILLKALLLTVSVFLMQQIISYHKFHSRHPDLKDRYP